MNMKPGRDRKKLCRGQDASVRVFGQFIGAFFDKEKDLLRQGGR